MEGFDDPRRGALNRGGLEFIALVTHLIGRCLYLFIGRGLLYAALTVLAAWFKERNEAEAEDETEGRVEILGFEEFEHLNKEG